MKTEVVKTTVFIAEDGKQFLNEKDCQLYEDTVIKRKKNIKYFRLHHSADFTEGRGFQAYPLAAVEAEYNNNKVLAEMFCQIAWGNRVQWCYSSPAPAWDISDISENDYLTGEVHRFGKKIFVSHSDMEGLPKAIHITDKTVKKDIMI